MRASSQQIIQRIGETDQLYLQGNSPEFALERADLALTVSHIQPTTPRASRNSYKKRWYYLSKVELSLRKCLCLCTSICLCTLQRPICCTLKSPKKIALR